ncbi:uncharacterized protein MAM_07351 [Metarhizium album ARSEF 1941]|uniref:Uncharacterized protein n=1 Tax=Metarhizium album (strain ARSEF 1941) TaxID=1081103 RepID=A0A0B2WP48_METAS|nr:uncharacterized protein MAM_07351 [Metarhizium album ARSEF 1941]KHN94755.1 hypothetical protein MAM_07351 [Metarhizium album ARSEF 1941]
MKTTLLALLAAVASVIGSPVPEPDPEANPVDYGKYPPPKGGYGDYPPPKDGYGSYPPPAGWLWLLPTASGRLRRLPATRGRIQVIQGVITKPGKMPMQGWTRDRWMYLMLRGNRFFVLFRRELPPTSSHETVKYVLINTKP